MKERLGACVFLREEGGKEGEKGSRSLRGRRTTPAGY